MLPKAAAERQKLGFPVPIGHWLKGDAYGFADRLPREAETGQKRRDRTLAWHVSGGITVR